MEDYRDILEFVSDYINESKGNALDKLYGKDLEKIRKINDTLDAAKETGMPKAYRDKKLAERDAALKSYENKLNKRKVFGSIAPSRFNSEASYRDYLLKKRAANNWLTDDEKVDLKLMKQELGHGFSGLKKDEAVVKANGSRTNKRNGEHLYLNMQKAKDKIEGVKRESTEVKLNIYEACDAGIITPDEKYELLSLIED